MKKCNNSIISPSLNRATYYSVSNISIETDFAWIITGTQWSVYMLWEAPHLKYEIVVVGKSTNTLQEN